MRSKRNHGQRPNYQRASIADEAARIMMERGMTDFRLAKAKACERLGLNTGPLPSNEEVEAALAARNRIFHGDRHDLQLRRLREAAVQVMRRLDAFSPRLVGSVLTGTATEHSAIDLHLYTDTPETVGAQLAALGLEARTIQFQHQWRRGEAQTVPGYRFYEQDFEYLAAVFPERRRAHAPLSRVDGRPMRRANQREVARLLDDEGLPSAL
ncbi:MAG: hypothetical protein JSV45_05340 [Chromatiales bacterium]|nr:MAG: hypothetical protein JSV45_05340 [Chromatiales bacterium]